MGFEILKKQLLISSIFFMFFQTSLCAKSPDVAKNEIKSIESKINVQNEKIKDIDEKKEDIEAQIKKNETEIQELKKENEKLAKEIKEVKNSLLKNNKELIVTGGELKKIRMIHDAELAAWNRYMIFNSTDEVSEVDKLSAQKVIFKNVKDIESVQGEVSNIKQEKVDIEKKKAQLEKLNAQANANRKKLDRKVADQEKLAKKLNKDKINYEAIIAELKKKKAKIEKEIDNILKASTKKPQTPVKYSAAKKGVGRLEKPLAGEIVTRYKESKSGIALNGIEIRGELGSAIKSSAKGKVIYSNDFQGLGKVIMVEYGYDLIGVYGNLISTDVKVGDTVAKSEKIGVLGYSSDGQPDLYYEVRFNMKSVNPESFF